MEHVKSFHVMFLILLSMQFAMSNGDLVCFVFSYAPCYKTFTDGLVKQECLADPTIKCLEDNKVACGITNSTEIDAMVRVLGEVCREGTELHNEFLNSRDCLFGKDLAQKNGECYQDLIKAMSKYTPTGNAEKDKMAVFKITCEYSGDIKACISKNVKDTCGADAQSFQKKLQGPAADMEEKACNSAATFGFLQTLLFQAAAILISLQYFRLTK